MNDENSRLVHWWQTLSFDERLHIIQMAYANAGSPIMTVEKEVCTSCNGTGLDWGFCLRDNRVGCRTCHGDRFVYRSVWK